MKSQARGFCTHPGDRRVSSDQRSRRTSGQSCVRIFSSTVNVRPQARVQQPIDPAALRPSIIRHRDRGHQRRESTAVYGYPPIRPVLGGQVQAFLKPMYTRQTRRPGSAGDGLVL